MEFLKSYTIVFIAVILFCVSCSSTKSLPEGEKLYTGSTVTLKAEGLSSKERKSLRSDLAGNTRPRPNAKFLGLPFKLYIYNALSKKKPKSFLGKLRARYGEPPVLLSSVNVTNNVKILQGFLENRGFFKAKVTGDTVVKKKTGSAKYMADAGNQYTINSVAYISDSTALTVAIQQATAKKLLQEGKPYNLDLIKFERSRIDAVLKEQGFYYFSPEYLLIQVDSTRGDNTVDMRVVVKPETPQEARQPYRINNVYVYTGYNLNGTRQDTSKAIATEFEGYNIIDPRNRFKPRLFAQMMQFQPGDIYSRTDHNLTLSRLINLNVFKYVKNRFEQVGDSALLDTYYYLTPMPKKSLRAEINATSKSNNLTGSQVNFSWRNRNALRGAEQLSLSAYIGSEVQFGGVNKGFNTYRSGAELNFTLPRFFIPFTDIRTRGGYVPRTNLQLGYDVVNRQKLYTLNSFRFGFGYLWRESVRKQHEFYPFSVNYVQPLNVTQRYRDSIRRFPYLSNIIDSQFVIGSTYQFNFNDLVTGVQKTNSFYFNALFDASGNVASLFAPGKGNPQDPKRLFNATFDQYIKIELDGRYYRRLGANNTWANRVILGYGNPFGNSDQLPFIKQYFVGGNNSLRAFRSRSVGPGTYYSVTDNSFIPDQGGDLKLEFNTEFRPRISGPVYGAVFIDAGNIWLKNEDPNRPGSAFSKDFIKQLAIGTGVGVRLDITLFVIRLDVGFPIRKPWEDNPWVMQQIRFNNADWRRDNIVYNLAIGYPF